MKVEKFVVKCRVMDHPTKPVYVPVASNCEGPNAYRFYDVIEISPLEDCIKEEWRYAWDVARTIVQSPEYSDVHQIFGVDCQTDVFDMPFEKVIAICQAWEDRIKVGDVCMAKRSDGKTEKVVVLSAGSPEAPDVLVLRKNMQTTLVGTDNLTQTGESLANELNYILKIMKEDDE